MEGEAQGDNAKRETSFGAPFSGKPQKEQGHENFAVDGKAREILKDRPDVFPVVYTLLDRIYHFHWAPLLLGKGRK